MKIILVLDNLKKKGKSFIKHSHSHDMSKGRFEVDFDLNHQRSIFATRLSEFVKSSLYGKCAVVGAGIYGITAATKLRTAGYIVDLYDSESEILKKASGINQYRIHRGYHYPRSPETIESCKSN